MEQINKVELRGNVGMVYLNKAGGRRAIRISLATNVGYHASDGSPVIETTWHTVRGFSDKMVGGPIAKGDKVQVEGRLRTQQYTDADGNDRTSYFILAQKIKKLPDGALACQSA